MQDMIAENVGNSKRKQTVKRDSAPNRVRFNK